MTSREKVVDVERQIREMLDGETTEFSCPFCTVTTTEGQGILCCNEAAEVINAILDHLEHMERCEIVESAMDRLHSMPSRVILN